MKQLEGRINNQILEVKRKEANRTANSPDERGMCFFVTGESFFEENLSISVFPRHSTYRLGQSRKKDRSYSDKLELLSLTN